MAAETEQEMVQRHLAQAERIIGEQKARIAELDARGQDTRVAHDLLASYEKTREVALEHLRRLQEGVWPKPAPSEVDRALGEHPTD